MPLESDLAGAQAGGNNSSDFVRKLYKMLEDPSYNQVVRWSADGDSFVVLENERFTKTILPKHFKHSNFASFVRQLNKYDFHKVRHNEENGETPYGKDAWEFRHPEFRADRKDNLDNIRRKAPAPRKPQQAEEAFPTSQQIVVLSESLAASQHQIQALQENYYTLMQTNKVLVSELVSLQKMVKAQQAASNEVITHLSGVDSRRRDSRPSAQSSHSSHSGAPGGFQNSSALALLPDAADEQAPALRRARELLNGVLPDPQAERELERLSVAYHHQSGSPPDSATSSVVYSQPGSAPIGLLADPLNDVRHMVYPVGQTAGIDPFHSDHIHNIPYSRPLSNPNPIAEAPVQVAPPPTKDRGEHLWGAKKPNILLVEDDKTCSRIGAKFLKHLGCVVDVAQNGLEAVNKINQNNTYFDLIFMDIIMPQLDGVSATSLIRMASPRIPIIAMTSNIRQEDIAMYFQFGMNDVLAKPFTRDGMIRILRKHLTYILRDPPPPGMSTDDMSQNGGTASAGPSAGTSQPYGGQAGMNLAHMVGSTISSGVPVKFEQTPIQSPATTSSWHSPNQMSHTSPNLDSGGYMSAVGGGQGGMVLTPGGTQRPQYSDPRMSQMPTPTLGSMADDGGDDRPDKRQRIFGPGQGTFVQ